MNENKEKSEQSRKDDNQVDKNDSKPASRHEDRKRKSKKSHKNDDRKKKKRTLASVATYEKHNILAASLKMTIHNIHAS